MSMTKIAPWIGVCAGDWAAESAIKASNVKVIIRYHGPWIHLNIGVFLKLRLSKFSKLAKLAKNFDHWPKLWWE